MFRVYSLDRYPDHGEVNTGWLREYIAGFH